MGKRNVAEEYSKTSNDYWTLAKKDAFRDLTAAGGFIALAVASNYANKALLVKEEAKEEPGWCDNIPVLNTICEYKKSAAGVIGLGSIGSAVLFKDNIRQQLITIRNGLSLRIGTGNRSKAALPWIRSIRNKLNFCIKFIEPESPVVDLSKPIRWPKRDYNG